MSDNLDSFSIASEGRMLNLVAEAESELLKLKPEINYLIECQNKLEKLKQREQKLNSIIISLKSLIDVDDVTDFGDKNKTSNLKEKEESVTYLPTGLTKSQNSKNKIFLPQEALNAVAEMLRPNNNLNYEIYKAIVHNAGIATTEQIKEYLIRNKIRQPQTGRTFERIELKEISSRANYLVRKKIVVTMLPGYFRAVYGWKGA